MMKYEPIDKIEKPLSRLVYGTGSSLVMGDYSAKVEECLDMAWEYGFRAFDTAYAYGNAESNFGRWMDKRGYREELVIVDKGCNPGQNGSTDVFSAQTIRGQMEESLERMRTDHTDLYILHRDDESKPVDEIVEVLNELASEGKVKVFGVSNWRMQRVIAANTYAKEHGLMPFSVVSPCYSLAEFVRDPWGGSVTISGEGGKAYREWLQANQMPVFNYSALARGFLSGKYRTTQTQPIEETLWWAPIEEYYCSQNVERLSRAEQLAAEKGCTVSQICLAWLFGQELNLFPIVSPTSESHIKDNVETFVIKLSDVELQFLECK